MLKALFTRTFLVHPASVGESYIEHLGKAGGFGLRLMGAGMACLVHAVVPSLCKHTGSEAVAELHDELARRRAQAGTPSRPSPGMTTGSAAR